MFQVGEAYSESKDERSENIHNKYLDQVLDNAIKQKQPSLGNTQSCIQHCKLQSEGEGKRN